MALYPLGGGSASDPVDFVEPRPPHDADQEIGVPESHGISGFS
jgi:hypothetical protein